MHGSEETFEILADPADLATRAEMIMMNSSIARHQESMNNVYLDPEFDGVTCVECGSEIHKARLASVKTDKCAPCQQEVERIFAARSRQYAS